MQIATSENCNIPKPNSASASHRIQKSSKTQPRTQNGDKCPITKSHCWNKNFTHQPPGAVYRVSSPWQITGCAPVCVCNCKPCTSRSDSGLCRQSNWESLTAAAVVICDLWWSPAWQECDQVALSVGLTFHCTAHFSIANFPQYPAQWMCRHGTLCQIHASKCMHGDDMAACIFLIPVSTSELS